MFHLYNAYDGLILSYPLAQLKGRITPYCGCKSIHLSLCSVGKYYYQNNWSTCGALFKVFAPLQFGENCVELSCNHHIVHLKIVFKSPCKQLYFVRPVFVICSDEIGEFQVPEGIDCSKESACKRIGFAIRLLQTITAELFLHEHGERYTFLCWNNDHISSGDLCLCHYSRLKRKELTNCCPQVAWTRLACELQSYYGEEFLCTKWVAFVACTRFTSTSSIDSYDNMLGCCEAYFALAVGGLALLGTGTLHSWPENVSELQKVLVDDRKVADYGMMNDTAYRNKFWAACATGIGSVLHELGHCFGLQHSADGVMQRGADDIHLVIAFPPPDVACANGCQLPVALRNPWTVGKLQAETVDKLQMVDRRKMMSKESGRSNPLPTAVQFSHYTCLPLTDSQGDVAACDDKRWSYCCSISHHGGAFWGLEQLDSLLKCQWIVPASSSTRV